MKISIEGSSKTFEIYELAKALKHSGNLSKKKKKVVDIVLPSCEIIVSTFTPVEGRINIKSQDSSVVRFVKKGVLSIVGDINLDTLTLVSGEKKLAEALVCAGNLSAKSCKFENISLLSTGLSKLALTDCVFKGKGAGCALKLSSSGELDFKNLTIDDYAYGISVSENHETSQNSLSISKASINVTHTCVEVDNASAVLNEVEFSVDQGTGISVHGKSGDVRLTNSAFKKTKIGVKIANEAKIFVNDAQFLSQDKTGIAFLATTGGMIEANSIDIASYEIGFKGELAAFTKLKSVNIKEVKTGIVFSSSATIEGDNVNIAGCEDIGVHIINEGIGVLNNLSVNDCDKGVLVKDSGLLQLKSFKCSNFQQAIHNCDAAIQVRSGKVINKGTGVGVCVKFTRKAKFKVLLRDYAVIGCDTGGEFIDKDLKHEEMLSRSVVENCSFIKCNIGCYVDRAAVDLYGTSFVINNKNSIIIKNQILRNVGQLRKEARLRMRWLNIIEKKFEDGEQISNNNVLFAECTEEKEFRVLQDFESVLYRAVLSERLRQAMNFFRSRDMYSMNLARVIIKSVFHCMKLVKALKSDLLSNDLLESPQLGMFTATFQMNVETKQEKNTLIEMDDLLESWQNLKRIAHFDEALKALDEAFERKQISDEVFDDWVAPLEEMQRECYIKSKYNRRRDYLLDNAKKNPLSAWYFLAKEDKSTAEGTKIRKEILHFLAACDTFHNTKNITNFSSTWVGQWAVAEMAGDFLKEAIPQNYNLRRAWGDNLLDKGKPSSLLTWYNSVQHDHTPMDQMMQFEAYKQKEAIKRLTSRELKKCNTLLNGGGSAEAIRAAARSFSGEGALPGYLRRLAETATNIEDVLVALRPVYEDHYNEKWKKERVCIATLAHYFVRDPTTQPKLLGQKDRGYETCPMCFIQKLQPWNELKLEACKEGHLYCRGCLRESMSQGNRDLWGRCPGQTDGKECTAIANRRDMEMSGMPSQKVFNILRFRVSEKLSLLAGWKDCTHCKIGGKSNVKKSYFTCKLCDNLVTEDGGESDPTVKLRLLQGLDGSKAARGEGVFRECYYCASPYEKGNACSTITCANCGKQFSMTFGNKNLTHVFDDKGVGPQRYVPLKPGSLWNLEVFKNRKGNRLKLGQPLNDNEVKEVLRRAKRAAALLQV